MEAHVAQDDIVLVHEFRTTGNGAADGSTLVCSTLTSWQDMDGAFVKIESGTYRGQARAINGSTITGTVTVTPVFDGQIPSGVRFSVIGIPVGTVNLAAILTRIGTNGDAAGTTTLFARLRQIVDSYLAEGTIGLNALRVLITAVGTAVAAVQTSVNAVLTHLTSAVYGLAAIKTAVNFEQIVPLVVNSSQTLNNTAADKDFIATNTRGATGLVSTDETKARKIFLHIVGVVVNTYAGSNALDCTTATHNQWQMNLDNGVYSDLVNGANADGQMIDNDWLTPVEGAITAFHLMFDVTGQVTNVDGNIGIRLQNGRSEQASQVVTVNFFLRVLWQL